ncbi:MAG: polyprenyl synthetase family protein [Anaerolineae bacterium]
MTDKPDYTRLLNLVETALREALAVPHPSLARFYGMMQYHLGWVDKDLSEIASHKGGKRLRSLLTLLACEATGGDVAQALPAAVAVELVHNFSLIHDDIEDRSEFRRHRETVWRLWGDAHAINVGDGLFALARLQLGRLLDVGVPAMRVASIFHVLDAACVALTEGQFLDMQFETVDSVSLDDYFWMIRGKTASLIACACEMGAMVACEDTGLVKALHDFGYNLGMAFQIDDDILGIWGRPEITGKPAGDDVLNRKKTLPVVYVLENGLPPGSPPHMRDAAEIVQQVYQHGVESDEDLHRVLVALEQSGAKDYCAQLSEEYTEQALAALSAPGLIPQPRQALAALAESLLGRQT